MTSAGVWNIYIPLRLSAFIVWAQWIHDSRAKIMEEIIMPQEQEGPMVSIVAKMIHSILLFMPIMNLLLIRLGIPKPTLHSSSQSTALIMGASHGNRILISLPIRFLCTTMEANPAIMIRYTQGIRPLSTILASTPIRVRHFLPLLSTMLWTTVRYH